MKHRHSPLAQLLALALLATVLFTRVAIAGYVCPPEAGAIVDASAMAVSVVNCQDMDDAQPALCADHRHDGRHWADANGHAPDLGMLPAAIGLVHVLPPAPNYDLQTSTDVCKSLKKGASAPFSIPASATEIHPQLPFLSDQLRHKNTGGTATG